MDTQAETLGGVVDPIERARNASKLIDDHQAAISELSLLRREALEELLTRGLTQTQIATSIGMTRARVGQLLSSGPRPERAFLGTGNITIAVGGKFEAGKANPGNVISAEMLATYERLCALAGSLNLKAEIEIVPPPGMVQLNRTNLIVCGGPRILPFVGQVLESDVNLGFGSDENGWFLTNKVTGQEFRSPADSGEGRDYAFLGRLPRPDGKGAFLFLSGIHAIGTKGAGKYLEDNLPDLYREVKNRRFSVIIASKYDPVTKDIQSVESVTPIYRHEGV